MADFSEFDNPNFSGQYRKYVAVRQYDVLTVFDCICGACAIVRDRAVN